MRDNEREPSAPQHGWRAVFPNGETCSIYPTAHEIVAWKQLTIEFGRPEDDLRSDGWRMEPVTITPREPSAVQEPVAQHKAADASGADRDNFGVDALASAMKTKLAKKRSDGRGGWQTCPADLLSTMLREHVKKGDPIDVANFCMMLFANGYGIAAPAAQSDAEPVAWGYAAPVIAPEERTAIRAAALEEAANIAGRNQYQTGYRIACLIRAEIDKKPE